MKGLVVLFGCLVTCLGKTLPLDDRNTGDIDFKTDLKWLGKLDGLNYFLGTQRKNQSAAFNSCKTMGMALVTLDTARQFNFLMNQTTEFGDTVWVDGSYEQILDRIYWNPTNSSVSDDIPQRIEQKADPAGLLLWLGKFSEQQRGLYKGIVTRSCPYLCSAIIGLVK